MAQVQDELERIVGLPTHRLRIEWRRHFRSEPPRGLSRDQLLRAVTYKMQERVHGGLSQADKKTLRDLAAKIDSGGRQRRPPPAADTPVRPASGTRVARPDAQRAGRGGWFRIPGSTLPFTERDRPSDHRCALVRAAVLRRLAGRQQACDGDRSTNSRSCGGGGHRWLSLSPPPVDMAARLSAVRSTPANRPRKGSSRTSTRCMRSAKPARPSSRASSTKAGSCCQHRL